MPGRHPSPDTSSRILDIAERMVQTRGFNAFSYADIAAALHVTKASLHYHFPSKAKLGERLVERYRTSFLAALDGINQRCRDAGAKLQAYVALYTGVLDHNRMCLCGMLAADYATLPKPMKDEVRRFFDANEVWLVDVLRSGRESNELEFKAPALETARLLVAALEGAMLLARSHGDAARLRSAADCLLADLGVRAPPPDAVAPLRKLSARRQV
jgi:TetR/AcrR family transcriptional regulator, transcriptional repressor for nem operon